VSILIGPRLLSSVQGIKFVCPESGNRPEYTECMYDRFVLLLLQQRCLLSFLLLLFGKYIFTWSSS